MYFGLVVYFCALFSMGLGVSEDGLSACHSTDEDVCSNAQRNIILDESNPHRVIHSPSSSYCWKVKVPAGHRVRVHFRHFNLTTGYDFLAVGDLWHGENRIIPKSCLAEFSGDKIPSDVTSLSTGAWIRFRIDPHSPLPHRRIIDLKVSYELASDKGDEEIVLSENHPNHTITKRHYGNNEFHHWLVKAPPTFTIAFTVLSLDIEGAGDFAFVGEEVAGPFRAVLPHWRMLTGNRTAEVIKDYSYSSASNQLIIFFTSNFQSSKTGFQFHVQALPSQDSAVDTATVDRVTYIESTVSPYPDLNSTSERRGDILSRLVFIVGLTVTGLLMCIVLSAMAIRCLKKRRRVKLQLNYYDQSHGDDDRISTADESDFSSALPVRIFRHHHHPPSESRTELFSSELSSAWSSPNISTYPYSDWSAVTDNTTNSEQTAVPMQASCGNLFAIHRPQISRAPPTSGRSHQFLITLPLEIQRSQLFHAMSCHSVLDNETDNAEGQSTADRTNRSSFSDVSTEMGSRDVITTACQTDPFTHDHAHRSHASTGNAIQGGEETDEGERECEANDNVVENESEQSSMSSRQEGANITTTIPETPASLTDTDRVCATGSVSASNQPPRGSVQRKVSHIYFKGAGVQRPEPESDPENPREPLSAGVTSPIQSIVQWFEGKKEDSNAQITHTYYKGSQVRHPKRPDAPPNLPHATLLYEDASSLRLS